MQTIKPSPFSWHHLCLVVCLVGCSPTASVPAAQPAAPSAPPPSLAAAAPPAAPKAEGSSQVAPLPQVADTGAGTCPKGFVRIAPGSFTMGSPEDEEGRGDHELRHEVTLTRAFCLMATEVTQGEWKALMGNNPSELSNCGANCPVERLSWYDAVEYANARSHRDGLLPCYSGTEFVGLTCAGYRLPTDAEWEYAARAGTKGPTYGDLDAIAWIGENAGTDSTPNTTHPVGQKLPNAWGLHDMFGNVCEWTNDWSGPLSGAMTDPTGAPSGLFRVVRGGGRYSYEEDARAAYRFALEPENRTGDNGVRLAARFSSVGLARPSGTRCGRAGPLSSH